LPFKNIQPAEIYEKWWEYDTRNKSMSDVRANEYIYGSTATIIYLQLHEETHTRRVCTERLPVSALGTLHLLGIFQYMLIVLPCKLHLIPPIMQCNIRPHVCVLVVVPGYMPE
jgi:hypothetical protein